MPATNAATPVGTAACLLVLSCCIPWCVAQQQGGELHFVGNHAICGLWTELDQEKDNPTTTGVLSSERAQRKADEAKYKYVTALVLSSGIAHCTRAPTTFAPMCTLSMPFHWSAQGG